MRALQIANCALPVFGLTHASAAAYRWLLRQDAYAALVSAPLRLYALMLIIAVAFALGLGVSAAFVDAPEVFQFAIASAVSMLLTPCPMLMVLAPIFTVFSVIPLLETSTASERCACMP